MTRLAGRGLRPGEELLRSQRWRRRQRINKGAAVGAVPMALFVAVYALRLGPILGFCAVAVAVLLVGLSIGWLRTTYWVALGPDYVRAHTGLQYHVFRPGSDLRAVRMSTDGGAFAEPTADVLYLRQGRRRATVLLGPEDQQRVVDLLGVQPHEANARLLRSLPPEQRAVLPYWQRRPVAMAFAMTAVVLVFVVIFAVSWIGQGNATYRADATRRLDAFAAARLGPQPGWEPQGPASIGWEGDTDHEPLTWQRSYTVPFGDKKSFLAAWTELTGGEPVEPNCVTDTYRGVNTVHCEASGDMSFDGARLFVDAKFDSGVPDHPHQLDLAVTDHRD